MIYSVHGTLIAKAPSLAVVECGGVGYGLPYNIYHTRPAREHR